LGLTASQYRLQAAVVVELRGEIDLATEEIMRSALTNAISAMGVVGADGPRLVVCDMTHVGFLSCCGLTVLLQTRKALRRRRMRMRVVAQTPVVVMLIEIMGLAGTLGLCAELKEAIRAPVVDHDED
jgi:anti-anti-sigma factor